MTLQTFGPHEVGSKYHVEAPTPKHVENSRQGIRHAYHHRIKTIDLDILPDKVAVEQSIYDGHIPNTHWPHPLMRDGFRDPENRIGRDANITHMRPDQWGRLVAGHRWTTLYHIDPIEEQLALCARLHRQALVEPKHHPVFVRESFWSWFAGVCESTGVRIGIYSLFHGCLPVARDHGFEAWAI